MSKSHFRDRLTIVHANGRVCAVIAARSDVLHWDQPAAGVFRLRLPLALASPDHINCYLLCDPYGDVLVDTGMIGSEVALDSCLAEIGAKPDGVLATHGHIDHWGLATRFVDRMMAHPACSDSFNFVAQIDRSDHFADAGGSPFPAEMERVFSQYRQKVSGIPDRDSIAEGDMIGKWRILWTPGHAPGHVCLLRELDGVLIAGDHLLPGFTPNIQPSMQREDALSDYLDSLSRMHEIDVRLVLPAHGEPFADASGRADELLDHHQARLHALENALMNGPTTLQSLTEELFRKTTRAEDRILATMETFAHLEYLRLRGRADSNATGEWSGASCAI